jgi:hypothetical protein
VFANLKLAWLSANFPHAQQLCVLRHPCGQFRQLEAAGLGAGPGGAAGESTLGHRSPATLRRAHSVRRRVLGARRRTLGGHRARHPPQTEADRGRLIVSYEWALRRFRLQIPGAL